MMYIEEKKTNNEVESKIISFATLLVKFFLLFFFLFNDFLRIILLNSYGHFYIYPISAIIVISCYLLLAKEQGLFFVLYAFGFSFFLFGFRPYDIQSHFFELVVSLFATAMLIRNWKNISFFQHKSYVFLLFISYILIAFSSLVLLPLSQVVTTINLWGIVDYFNYIINATPELPEFSLSAFNRMLLFFCSIVVLSNADIYAEKYYRYIFIGAVYGLLFSVVLGLLEYFNILSLHWYVHAVQNRLHSTFLNRGWFSEYAICLFPLAFLKYCKGEKSWFRTVSVVVFMLLTGLAVLFSGARTGWGLYILLFALLVFVFWDECVSFYKKIFLCIFIVGFVVVSLAFFSSSLLKISVHHDPSVTVSHKSMAEKQDFLKKRLQYLFKTGRIKNWKDTLHIIDNYYLFGRGYESFSRQGHILENIPASRYKKYQQHAKIRETAHNFYLQLIVSNGLAGLLLWTLIAGYAAWILLVDYKKNRYCPSVVFLLSFIGFHLYAITQNMQYIPMIWYLIFLLYGYTATRERIVMPWREHNRLLSMVVAVVFMCSGTASIAYSLNVDLHKEAQRYGLRVFDVNQDRARFVGFYGKEVAVEDQGFTYRWTGKKAKITLGQAGVVSFIFSCGAPELAERPMGLIVLRNGIVIDNLTIWNSKPIKRKYYTLAGSGVSGGIFEFRASRTWTPSFYGQSRDHRRLGVAVSGPKFVDHKLSSDIGLYRWEIEKIMDELGTAHLFKYRWTRKEAVFDLKKHKGDQLMMLIKTSHPDINSHPVTVSIMGGEHFVKIIELTDHKWTSVSLWPDIDNESPLFVRVDRTWNPRKSGYMPDDPRDVGAAVIFFTPDSSPNPSVF